MEKKEKKKNLSDLAFKIIFTFAVIFLIFAVIKSPMSNFSFEKSNLRTIKKNEPKNEKASPAELKWQDSFKGISNKPSKEEEKSKFFK